MPAHTAAVAALPSPCLPPPVHIKGIVVETLQDAHDLMESLLSSRTAPLAFGLALLCAGQLSTFTGTIAGQVGLAGWQQQPWQGCGRVGAAASTV